jgi:hypothetical protein
MAVVEEQHHSGKLVALEGDIDAVSTQLRLLPPSQKILVLPSLLENLRPNTEKDDFDARAFVRDVHTAFTERTETARSFLQSSTSAHPKLVFMNGGSVSARITCITRICENLTNRGVGEAETIFNEIVKYGVAGLMREEGVAEEEVEAEGPNVESAGGEATVEDRIEDQSFRATKAADTLDRETTALQSESNARSRDDLAGNNAVGIMDCAETSPVDQTRDSQVHEEPDEAEDVVFTNQHGDKIVRTVVTMPTRNTSLRAKRSTFGPRYVPEPPFNAPANYASALVHQTENDNNNYEYDADVASPGGDSIISVPPTPGVVYGEACLVDVQSVAPKNYPKRVKSVDRFFLSNSRFHEAILSPKTLKHMTSDSVLGDRPATSGGRILRDSSHPDLQTLPRTTFVRASETVIKRPPPTSGSVRSSTSSATRPTPRVFVDRGTDAGETPLETPISEDSEINKPLTPVFTMVEDLIIHFTNGTSDEIFKSVVRSYKDGSYPIAPESQITIEEPTSSPSTISSLSSSSPDKLVPPLRPTYLTSQTDDGGHHTRTEYDPYGSQDSYPPDTKRQRPPRSQLERADSAIHDVEPPATTITHPLEPNNFAAKFVEFSPANPTNAISAQNSLRSVLNIHFPAGENGYSQYYYPIAPEANRLWKPVFRNDDTVSIGNEDRTFDQIIALGCEEGVKKDFFAQVSGQVERLGIKKDGMSRSGKLDIRYVFYALIHRVQILIYLRYLIANVMQSFSSLSLTTQSTFNSLSNPALLATLLVPHIEAYLAANTTIRLLILHYPSHHLTTVFALRNLLGSDLLKIAGILDSLSSDPPSIIYRPQTSTNPLSNDAISSRSQTCLNSLNTLQHRASIASHISTFSTTNPTPQKTDSGISFSKANYLLPSTATDAEITTFLSSIWESLVEKSTFYDPEPEPKPIIIEKPPLPPTPISISTGTRGDSDRDSAYQSSSYRAPRGETRDPKTSRLTGNSATRPRTPKHSYTPSITSTVHTTASGKGRKEEAEWENFYIGEDDSEDDEYDRMIMGRSMAKIVPEVRKQFGAAGVPKRSTKKALKWLGLA